LIEGTDHDLTMTASDFKNVLGQKPSEGGICSPCHVAHKSSMQKYLWSAPIGPTFLEGWDKTFTSDQDIMIMMCTGCHSPGNIAESHVPKFGLHPRGKLLQGMPLISFDEVRDEFPIFTDPGDIAEHGNIVCSSCHDPHKWNPYAEEKGTGKEVEGDVTNSFLRPNLHSKYCTGCHGKEALPKFKYYHSDLGRVKEDTTSSIK
jgi:hypothetical protein